MSFQYPPKPWFDGQTVRRDMGDETVLIGTYNLSKNLWSFARSKTDGSGPGGIVTTADVFTLNARPTDITSPFDLTDEPGTVVNQQEANWWMFEDIDKRSRKTIIQDTPPTSHPLYTTAEKKLIIGDMWLDTTKDVLFWYDGTDWQEFSGGRSPIFSDTEPLVHPDFLPPNDQLVAGDVWYDTTDPDEIVSYIYDGTDWLKVGSDYVHRKGGDIMEGPLEIDGGRSPNADGIVSTLKVLNVDSGENSDLQLRRFGATGLYISSGKNITVGDLKFNTDGAKIVSPSNVNLAQVNSGGIFYDGGMTVERHLVNKGYVDEQIDEVVGLLGGIGSSNKAGVFTWQASGGITPGGWQFEGRTNPDYQYSGLNKINISKTDKAGNTWSIDDFPVDEVLRIEDESDGHFLEGHITAAVDGGPASIQVTYTIDEANGTADGDQVISVGENLDHKYVERTGDSMTGQLEMIGSRIVFNNIPADSQVIRANRSAGTNVDLLYLAHNGGQVQGFYDVRMTGNTSYNGIRFKGGSGGDSPIFEMRANGNYNVFYSDLRFDYNRIRELGPAVDDDDAVTYGQVKQELADFRDSVVQELSFGTWSYSSNQVTPFQTRFYVRGTNGATSNVSAALVDTLIFNVEDLYGNIGPFDRVDVGELFTLSREGIVLKYRVTEAPTISGSQNDGRVIGVNFVSQSQSTTFAESQVWNVQLTEFSDISVDQLDDTYLRLDTANDPLDSLLTIQTPSFGEAKLTLKGRRDNANNTCATIEFNNQDETDFNKIGYITYFNKGTDQRFEYNQDIYLKGDVHLSFNDGGAIQHNGGDRIVFNSADNGNIGSGLVNFTRPGNNSRRGFVLKGKYIDSGGNTVSDGDLFFSYTNNDEDAVNYFGKTTGLNNIQTFASVQSKIADAIADFDPNITLEQSPFIANLSETVRAVNTAIPARKQIAGFYSSSGAPGDVNRYVGNWNSYIGCGLGVVSTQAGTNSYTDLPAGYDEEWLGSVTIIDKNSGGMKYKNTLYRVQRVDDVIRLWVRPTGSMNGKKPIFGIGEFSELTDVFVVVEGYRIASS